MCARWLESQLDEEYGKDFQVIPSRVRELDPSRYRVLWCHDQFSDPENRHLKTEEGRNRWHRIVCCSHWQQATFFTGLGVPLDSRTLVIDTPVKPIDFDWQQKDSETIDIVYTSTPSRGLDILVTVFLELAKKYSNIRLHVFSSFKIYGWDEADKQYEELFKICKEHPQIIYHGFQSNEVVREQLKKSHIFGYSSTHIECNSRSLIEAMSAGLYCVHPDYASLCDTAGGMTDAYPFYEDKMKHAKMFYDRLERAILHFRDPDVSPLLLLTKAYADVRFNEERILEDWKAVFEQIKEDYGMIGRHIPNDKVIEFKI